MAEEAITTSAWWASNIGMSCRRRAPVRPDNPEPGYYRLRMRKNGPWVAARIWHYPSTGTLCRVGNRLVSPAHLWPLMQPISINDWRKLENTQQADLRVADHEPLIDIMDQELKP